MNNDKGDDGYGRYECRKERPFDKALGKRWFHPASVEVGEQQSGWPSGDTQDYECPFCKLTFTVELPQ